MTIERVIEVSLTSAVAATTTAIAVMQVAEAGLTTLAITIGVSAVVGYFSAQMTINVKLERVSTELAMLREELHRYYQTRER